MSAQNQSEKDPKDLKPAQDAVAVKAPSATERELTDDEIAVVAGGLKATGVSGHALNPQPLPP
jgi:hypothetical protein